MHVVKHAYKADRARCETCTYAYLRIERNHHAGSQFISPSRANEFAAYSFLRASTRNQVTWLGLKGMFGTVVKDQSAYHINQVFHVESHPVVPL